MNQFYDNIEAYINGELEGTALQEFETALISDTALQQAVAQHRDMVARLSALRLRETVKKNIVRPSEAGGSFTFSRRLLAAAASLLLVAAAVYFWQQSPAPDTPGIAGPAPAPLDSQAVVETPAKPDTSTDTPRPVPPAPGETLTKDNAVLIACAEAVQQMGSIDYTTMGTDEKDPALERQLNEAIRLLRAKKPAQAEALLDLVLKKKNALYQEDAEWLNALSWLMRDPAKGKKLLQDIEQNPANGYRKNAIDLLDRIE